MYGSTPMLKIFALDAATGKQKWIFDPSSFATNFAVSANRGVTYWKEGDDKRIFFTAGTDLFALNAETGELIQSFGNSGSSSLKADPGDWAQELFVASRTPGIIFGDLLIMGTVVSEGAQAAPGYIRAFDVKTGKVLWTFRTIPKPGEFGYDTWPEDAHTRIGGVNAWAAQPRPVKPEPFSGQSLTQENVSDISKESHDFVSGILKNVRTGEQFIPHSTQGTVIYPGFDGGGEWGGAAIDPNTNILYVNSRGNYDSKRSDIFPFTLPKRIFDLHSIPPRHLQIYLVLPQ